MKPFQLPGNFLFGTATASLQIEGGDRNNNWYRFCEQGKTKDGTHCIVAADHWNRYKEDIALMKELNQQVYRMSIEWSRIEPRQGEYNEEALVHYRKILKHLLDNDIQPLVTLHHFSNPIWFEDVGGWANKNSPQIFHDFAKKVVYSLGDLVSDWITINEPNVYAEGTYSAGNYPPNKPNFLQFFKCAKYMAKAHILTYQSIHQIRKERGFSGQTMVGVANHLRIFDRKKGDFLAKIPTKVVDYIFHDIFMEAMIYGKFKFPIGFGTYPLGKDTYCDFMGINYYTRDIIKFSFNPFRLFSKLTVKENTPTNDLGWELYPEGLYRICKKAWDDYGFPIFITENGTCDAKDDFRGQYIYDHLHVVKRLIDDGVDVQRYYHWSLIDNFEWDEGLTPRFGLIEVDYETQERTIRESAKFYGDIAKESGVTKELIEKYSFLQAD
ncbi:MAG TPA: glycoside hydrolase family 1 protein [Bacillota bacterium]|nr:glycoside hydrolase family 1 protein [Bacillota bacterium]